MSRVKKIGILALGQGINTLVNILFLPYMSRVLDYEDYGSYGQAILIIAFAAAILSAGLSQIIYIYLSKGEDKTSVLSSNVFGGLMLGLIGVILMWLGSDYFAKWLNNPKLTLLISIYCFSILFSIPNSSFNSFLIYTNKVKVSISLVILTNLLKIALVITAIQIYKSVELALLGIVISQLFLFITNLIIQSKNLEFKINTTIALEQIKKGFPLGLTGLIGAAILYTDGIMVSKLVGVKAYAIYRNGAIEVPFIATIYSSVAAVILPEVAKLFSNDKFKEIIELKKKVIMNSIFLIYPVFIFMAFNSQEFIVLYLGEKYQLSSIIFFIFNFTLLIRINDYSDVLISASKTKLILKYYLIALVANITLNYFLIQIFGTKGAALSSVISIGLLAFLQFKKTIILLKSKFKKIIDLKKIFIFVSYLLLIASIIQVVLQNIMKDSYYKIIIFSVLYFISVVIFFIKSNYINKTLLLQFLPNRLKKQLNKYGVR